MAAKGRELVFGKCANEVRVDHVEGIYSSLVRQFRLTETPAYN